MESHADVAYRDLQNCYCDTEGFIPIETIIRKFCPCDAARLLSAISSDPVFQHKLIVNNNRIHLSDLHSFVARIVLFTKQTRDGFVPLSSVLHCFFPMLELGFAAGMMNAHDSVVYEKDADLRISIISKINPTCSLSKYIPPSRSIRWFLFRIFF